VLIIGKKIRKNLFVFNDGEAGETLQQPPTHS